MQLKKGITGFWHINETSPAPYVDLGLVKLQVYAIEYTGEYKIAEIKDQEIANNYYRIVVYDKQSHPVFDILVNACYPYYCGITAESQWMQLEFIDLPFEIRQALDPHFVYLLPADLLKKVTPEDLGELSDAELGEIKYWKSNTFGAIIFNGYD